MCVWTGVLIQELWTETTSFIVASSSRILPFGPSGFYRCLDTSTFLSAGWMEAEADQHYLNHIQVDTLCTGCYIMMNIIQCEQRSTYAAVVPPPIFVNRTASLLAQCTHAQREIPKYIFYFTKIKYIPLSLSLHIYIYMYICVCVCVWNGLIKSNRRKVLYNTALCTIVLPKCSLSMLPISQFTNEWILLDPQSSICIFHLKKMSKYVILT